MYQIRFSVSRKSTKNRANMFDVWKKKSHFEICRFCTGLAQSKHCNNDYFIQFWPDSKFFDKNEERYLNQVSISSSSVHVNVWRCWLCSDITLIIVWASNIVGSAHFKINVCPVFNQFNQKFVGIQFHNARSRVLLLQFKNQWIAHWLFWSNCWFMCVCLFYLLSRTI